MHLEQWGRKPYEGLTKFLNSYSIHYIFLMKHLDFTLKHLFQITKYSNKNSDHLLIQSWKQFDVIIVYIGIIILHLRPFSGAFRSRHLHCSSKRNDGHIGSMVKSDRYRFLRGLNGCCHNLSFFAFEDSSFRS